MLVHVLLDLRGITFCKQSAVVVFTTTKLYSQWGFFFFILFLAENNMGAAVPSSAVQADKDLISQF